MSASTDSTPDHPDPDPDPALASSALASASASASSSSVAVKGKVKVKGEGDDSTDPESRSGSENGEYLDATSLANGKTGQADSPETTDSESQWQVQTRKKRSRNKGGGSSSPQESAPSTPSVVNGHHNFHSDDRSHSKKNLQSVKVVECKNERTANVDDGKRKSNKSFSDSKNSDKKSEAKLPDNRKLRGNSETKPTSAESAEGRKRRGGSETKDIVHTLEVIPGIVGSKLNEQNGSSEAISDDEVVVSVSMPDALEEANKVLGKLVDNNKNDIAVLGADIDRCNLIFIMDPLVGRNAMQILDHDNGSFCDRMFNKKQPTPKRDCAINCAKERDNLCKISSDGKDDEEDNGLELDDKSEELVFVQEAGFTIKIAPPGVEPFDVQVSSVELVQEMNQLLLDREDTCHRTCFSLQLDGNTLDNFAELKNVENLKEGSVIRVVEEPYTVREARIHVRHVRDLLKALDPADAYNGVDCSSLSFLNVVTQGDILEKKKSRPDSVDCTPPDYIMPGYKERLVLPLHPQAKEQKGPQCLKILTTSAWNPPPGPRKMHGDLLYLYTVTMEDKHFHITASTRGFFVNQSTEDEFNAKSSAPNHVCHSLVELLNHISPSFKRNFSLMQKKRTQRHPYERVATPYQVYQWAAPQLEHTLDAIRAEDAFSTKLGYEEHIPGQTREWNEELQSTRELSRKNLPERLMRERAIFKVHSDFVAAATRGAMAVIDGNVMAINPGEDAKMQMYIWNNIFFSLGFDVRDHYKDIGGDAAAFVAPRNDLQGVKVYAAVDQEGLYTLGTVVIDYRGYRVTAQSIIPGILEREQEQSVIYGSIDFGKTVVSNAEYWDLLNKSGQQLKILPHKVINDKGEDVELCSSVECKGIVGNDKRHYILDLLRTFPPDSNFLRVDGEDLSKDLKALGFPIEHKHKLACLRQELVDAFVEARYIMFIKFAAYLLQQLSLKKQLEQEKVNDSGREVDGEREAANLSENKQRDRDVGAEKSDCEEKESCGSSLEKSADAMETDEAKKIVESITEKEKTELEESTKDIVRKAALAVGSLKETEFDIRFNPDVFSPGVKHPEADGEMLKKQKQLVKDAAEFLVTVQIPSFIREILEHTAAPIDGFSLAESMHNRGINMRYLGKVADMLGKIPLLEYAYLIAVMELVTRSAKHLFTTYMQGVDMMSLSAAISHFLNCYLSSCPNPHAAVVAEESRNSKKKSKKRNRGSVLSVPDNEWANLTPKIFWSNVKMELKNYYDWSLEVDGVDAFLDKFPVQKISMLRSFCLSTGAQILLREYNMDTKNRPAFFEEDIVNIFPVVKHINPRASDAFNFYSMGQTKIQQGDTKEGFDMISEALNLLSNVYGAMHPEIGQCFRMLARLSYLMGEYQEAMSYQQKALQMSERVNGIDHAHTITEYAHLALYCFANSQVTTALKLLYRARYLALIVCGENHPEVALLDSNIGLILHAVGEYDLSLRFLDKSLQLYGRFYGAKSIKVAQCYHLVARTQSCMGDFRGALQSEKETYSIYKQVLGDESEKTKESSECLRHLTQQAVSLQKKMNEMYTGKMGRSFAPIQIQPPSMGTVLDMLNLVNGILVVAARESEKEDSKLQDLEEELGEKLQEEETGNDDEKGTSAVENDGT